MKTPSASSAGKYRPMGPEETAEFMRESMTDLCAEDSFRLPTELIDEYEAMANRTGRTLDSSATHALLRRLYELQLAETREVGEDVGREPAATPRH